MVLWAVRGQGFRAVLVAATVAGAVSVLGLALTGPDAWREFVTVLANAQPPCQSYNAISVACLFQPVTGQTIAKLLGYALVIACAVGVLAVRDRFTAFVLLGAAMLAGVTDMHIHFWVFGYVVLVVWLARTAARARTWVVPATAGPAVSSGP
jgi:hypothetical protein